MAKRQVKVWHLAAVFGVVFLVVAVFVVLAKTGDNKPSSKATSTAQKSQTTTSRKKAKKAVATRAAHGQSKPDKAKAHKSAKKPVAKHNTVTTPKKPDTVKKSNPMVPKVKTFKLSWKAKGPGSVQVTVLGDSPRNLTKPQLLKAGTKVQLIALPRSGAWFAGWYGSCIDYHLGTECLLTVKGFMNPRAVFKPIPVSTAPAPQPVQAPTHSAPAHTAPVPTTPPVAPPPSKPATVPDAVVPPMPDNQTPVVTVPKFVEPKNEPEPVPVPDAP